MSDIPEGFLPGYFFAYNLKIVFILLDSEQSHQ